MQLLIHVLFFCFISDTETICVSILVAIIADDRTVKRMALRVELTHTVPS